MEKVFCIIFCAIMWLKQHYIQIFLNFILVVRKSDCDIPSREVKVSMLNLLFRYIRHGQILIDYYSYLHVKS